jgi:hypothetical protein
MRYEIDKGYRVMLWLVYDNVTENYVFRGTKKACEQWIAAREKKNGP